MDRLAVDETLSDWRLKSGFLSVVIDKSSHI